MSEMTPEELKRIGAYLHRLRAVGGHMEILCDAEKKELAVLIRKWCVEQGFEVGVESTR